MIVLDLTTEELEELIFAEGKMYMDYDESRSADFNASIKRYNDNVEQLIAKMKEALEKAKAKEVIEAEA